MIKVLDLLALVGYFLAGLLWFGYLRTPQEAKFRSAAWVVMVSWLSHSLALGWQTWEQGFLPVANIGGALSFYSWLLMAAFILLLWRYPIKVLGGSGDAPGGFDVMRRPDLTGAGDGAGNPARFLVGGSYYHGDGGPGHLGSGLPGGNPLPSPGASAENQKIRFFFIDACPPWTTLTLLIIIVSITASGSSPVALLPVPSTPSRP